METEVEACNRSNCAEALLINHILEGRRNLFHDLVQPYLPILLRLARARMGDDAECEDVVQQTLLKAFTCLRQFRFESSFRTWLTRIAINEINRWWRRRKLSRFFVLDHAVLAELPIADPACSPLTRCERAEIRGLIREAIAKLATKYQAVFRLRHLANLSNSETANLLCLSVPAVKSRERRARLQMQHLLSASTVMKIHELGEKPEGISQERFHDGQRNTHNTLRLSITSSSSTCSDPVSGGRAFRLKD